MLTNLASKQVYHRPKIQISFSKTTHPSHKESTRDQIKGRIDQILRQDIEYLKYNFYQPNPQHKLQVTKQNKLINQYVHNNYEEYQLGNPLPHLSPHIPELSQSQASDSKRKNKKLEIYSSSKKKPLNLSDQRSFLQRRLNLKTEPNLDNIRELKYQPTKRLATNYNLQIYDKGSEKTTINLRNYNKSTKHIHSTNPTQHKINQSGHRLYPSEFSIKIEQAPTFEQSLIQSHYINEGIYPRITFNRDTKSRQINEQINPFSKVQLKQKIPQLYRQRFRYCIGCEKSLLEINIEYHQSVCLQFKNAFALSFEQLTDYVSSKIQNFQKQLVCSRDIQHDNVIVDRELTRLVEASSKSKKLGFRTVQFLKDFKKINDSCKLELQQLQRVSKLNWFLQIYENIRKKLKK